jgi:OOP family OmpA-OmpF porin
MKITTSLFCIGLAVVTVMGGCASQPKLTDEQIFGQFQKVSSLDSALQKARSNGAELLAPEGYARASKSLKQAMTDARSNKAKAAESTATEGLQTIDKLNRDTESSREILAEVLVVRDRAYAAGAKTLQGDKIAALDEDLKKTAALIEKGNTEQAKQRRPKLLADYGQFELSALKQGTVDLAKAAIADSKQQGAEKYSPKTLAQAEEEMALAVSILDADRTQTDKADLHAKKAKWLAEQSAAISETVKDFDRRDYSMEDVVLWHQQQLTTVNKPLGGQLPLNEPSDKVVLGLRNSVSKVIDERDMARNELQQAAVTEQESQLKLKAAEEKIAALMFANKEEMAKQRADYEKQVALSQQERQSMEQKDRAEQQRFEAVQAMFDGGEANVYRQMQNVLISAHGFQFPSGQSEIQADNFPLMNKIIRAIKIFPNAQIEVIGHTDSTGDDTANQVLSEARAEKVAKFLKEVGEITPDRITSRGYGEARPVASNETQEGRAENRRVEIKIVNK